MLIEKTTEARLRIVGRLDAFSRMKKNLYREPLIFNTEINFQTKVDSNSINERDSISNL